MLVEYTPCRNQQYRANAVILVRWFMKLLCTNVNARCESLVALSNSTHPLCKHLRFKPDLKIHTINRKRFNDNFKVKKNLDITLKNRNIGCDHRNA